MTGQKSTMQHGPREHSLRTLYDSEKHLLDIASLPRSAKPGSGTGGDAAPPTGRHGRGSAAASAASAAVTGWGGATLPADAGSRVPWFGRGPRGARGSHHQPRAAPRPPAPAAPPAPRHAAAHNISGGNNISSSSGGAAPPADALSVDDLVALARRLPRGEPLPDRALRALRHLDSRAISLLFKVGARRPHGGRMGPHAGARMGSHARVRRHACMNARSAVRPHATRRARGRRPRGRTGPRRPRGLAAPAPTPGKHTPSRGARPGAAASAPSSCD